MTLLLIALGAALGVGGLLGVLFSIDAYKSWAYRSRRRSEMRERPPIPGDITSFEIERIDDYWHIRAWSRDGNQVAWNTGEHPMDAIRYLVEQ